MLLIMRIVVLLTCIGKIIVGRSLGRKPDGKKMKVVPGAGCGLCRFEVVGALSLYIVGTPLVAG
jgi:hypothetical protein